MPRFLYKDRGSDFFYGSFTRIEVLNPSNNISLRSFRKTRWSFPIYDSFPRNGVIKLLVFIPSVPTQGSRFFFTLSLQNLIIVFSLLDRVNKKGRWLHWSYLCRWSQRKRNAGQRLKSYGTLHDMRPYQPTNSTRRAPNHGPTWRRTLLNRFGKPVRRDNFLISPPGRTGPEFIELSDRRIRSLKQELCPKEKVIQVTEASPPPPTSTNLFANPNYLDREGY